MARRFAGEDAPLFRDEALSRLRGSAWQPVLLSKPVSSYVLTAFSLTAAAALLGFAANFEFARKTQVQGYLVPATGWSRVTVNSYGVVSHHLLRLPDTWFTARHTGDVLSRFGSIAPIRSFLMSGAFAMVVDGFMAIGAFTVLLLYSWQMTLVLCLFLAFFAALNVATYAPLKKI